MSEPVVELVRLTKVPLDEVLALLNDPRLRRHMPMSSDMTREEVAEWVRAKDGQWQTNGYGPWAVRIDGEFAGWTGFQAEEGWADFALVLTPGRWGSGQLVAREALTRGFGELGLSELIIALPMTRSPERVVGRLGFVPDGEVTYGGARFRQFRLTHGAWLATLS